MTTQTAARALTPAEARKRIKDAHVCKVSVECGSDTFAELQISKREAALLVRAAEDGSGNWVAIAEPTPGVVVIGRRGF